MKYHFDHKVILNPDSEFESLYKWSLQEIDGNGKKLGRDLIPWFWSFNFRIEEITLRDTLCFDEEHKNGSREKEVVIEDRRFIYAKLTPERRKGQFRETSFSMFGTGRKISQIDLHVHKLENANERERCVTWGCVSYTDDLDHPKATTEDCLVFMMYVSAKRFAAYAEKISSSSINKAGLQVTGVTGFYSDWSPDIYTNQVKVLTGGNEHKVHIPVNCAITPPRLDNVFEAQLHFESTCKFGEPSDTSDDQETSEDEEESRPAPHETRYQTPSFEGLNAAVAKGTKLLSSLRTAAWIICILLIILIFKQ